MPVHRTKPSPYAVGMLAAALVVAPRCGAADDTVRFNRDIRPLLSDKCFACHGFDAKKRKAGLRLDTAEGAIAPDKDGHVAIKPGDLAGSELWRRINTTEADDVMPPPDTHKSLSDADKSLLSRWIKQGAKYQKHWAFEAPVAIDPPAVKPGTPVRNGIDRFLAASLEREGLAFSPEADRPTLLRRLSFDLRGLPPTPAEVDAFVADKSADAFEKCVDRFMGSPAYGERMARVWLDVARYADTHGMHLDNERQMWAYRDWVVSAFNSNLPFDRFTVDQLAGDLLPNPTLAQRVATGFNRCNVTTGEGGSIDAEFVFRYAVERTATTVQTWMGLTAGCAVCHDHKFDPLSAREFYSLYAFFNNSADPAMDGNTLLTAPVVPLRTPEIEKRAGDLVALAAGAEERVAFYAAKGEYADPADASPAPEPKETTTVWVEDDAPPGWKITASPGAPTRWVTASEGPVASGKRALSREDGGLAQDVLETTEAKFEVPPNGRFFARVYLDPAKTPRTIMLQYNTGEWNHRAVWGDIDAIEWGAKGTTQRAHRGPLPEVGKWVRLEFAAADVGLKAGDKISGIAFTQFGGRVGWDQAGVAGRVDPANDPTLSLAAWKRQYEGKDAAELPAPVRRIFKETSATNRTPVDLAALRGHFLARVCATTRPKFADLVSDADAARKRRSDFDGAVPSSFVWHDMEKPRDSFVMLRGAYDKPGEKVTRGVPAALPPLKSSGTPTRLDLARWLVSDEHPLTARVAANRFWQQFIGVGLVKTPEDFGSQGQPPSHPELLDWLAVGYRTGGWDTKALVRLIVTSHAYRQDSKVTAESLRRDPENRWLSRGPRFRLDAEQIRDNALFVSGLLDLRMGGKGVKPYQPPNIWEPVGFVGSNTREYVQDHGAALYRRSLYTFFKRTAPAPFLSVFDAPNREMSCSRRERSNTPLQALQLLNDVQHFEAARALGARMLAEGGPRPEQRIAWAYRTVLSRAPDPRELEIVRGALETHLARYRADGDAAKRAVTNGESKPPAGRDPAELAAYTLAANLLLNLDETVTRN